MELLPATSIIETGLNASRRAFETTVENLANKDTTKGVDGTPYKAKQVTFSSYLLGNGKEGVNVSVVEDDTPGPKVYDPTHPDADADGMVQKPNVNLTQEMVQGMDYLRSNEVISAVFGASKKMAEQALMLGKQQ